MPVILTLNLVMSLGMKTFLQNVSSIFGWLSHPTSLALCLASCPQSDKFFLDFNQALTQGVKSLNHIYDIKNIKVLKLYTHISNLYLQVEYLIQCRAIHRKNLVLNHDKVSVTIYKKYFYFI